jgi:hypothetical protein
MEELDAVGGLVATASDVHPPELASLFNGIGRRLGAAHELLTREHGLCGRAEAGSR